MREQKLFFMWVSPCVVLERLAPGGAYMFAVSTAWRCKQICIGGVFPPVSCATFWCVKLSGPQYRCVLSFI